MVTRVSGIVRGIEDRVETCARSRKICHQFPIAHCLWIYERHCFKRESRNLLVKHRTEEQGKEHDDDGSPSRNEWGRILEGVKRMPWALEKN